MWCLRCQKCRNPLEQGQGCMVNSPKRPIWKMWSSPKSYQKYEALRHHGGSKFFLTACSTFCLELFFVASVELHSLHLSWSSFSRYEVFCKTLHISQNQGDIILCFNSFVWLWPWLERLCVAIPWIIACIIYETYVSSPVKIWFNTSSPSSL